MKRLLLFLCFCYASCIQAQAYSYSDGSANLYNVVPDKIEYIPVKKENSSSGNYSGGKAKSIKLKLADFEILKALFEEAIKAGDPEQKREMGTGQIYKADKAGTKVILKANSDLKARIEKQLKLIMK